MIGEWLHFIFSKFIPTASAELLVWLNEWQTTAVGIVILIAGSIWVRAVLRSNQRTAYLISQSLKLMTEVFAESARGVASEPSPSLAARPAAAASQDQALDSRLDKLRAVIRGALSVIPQSNERVDPNIAQLLQNIANFSLDEEKAKKGLTEVQTRALAEMERCTAGLRTGSVENLRCAEAWDLLVRLHRAARMLRESSFDEPEIKAA
jgi:hypothetical protein